MMKIQRISRLEARNVIGAMGRTSMRLEPELWAGLEEVCRREGMLLVDLIPQIEDEHPGEPRTSAVRTWLFNYFRAAATEAGHAKAGHGNLGVAA